jgi:hypothetical protein
MITIKATGEQVTETREELAQKYFNTFGDGIKSVYAKGNMGIITLLSDLQGIVDFSVMAPKNKEYWRKAINDIKGVLIEDHENKKD